MANLIEFASIDEEAIKKQIKESFPWAEDDFIEESITTSAIMINALLMALESKMQDEALASYCMDICKMQERFADIRFNAAKQERDICASICDQIYDQTMGNTCCMSMLKMASMAIKNRDTPT